MASHHGGALGAVFVAILACAWPAGAAAFTFSDGTAAVCMTQEGVATERFHPADDAAAPAGYIGFTHLDAGSGWVIDWNMLMLSSVPAEEHDFVFFHECAHAKSGSFDELQANCLGLLDMRASGRAGKAVEARLAAYHRRLGYMGPQYGLSRDFWARTVTCANHSVVGAKATRAPGIPRARPSP
jgi:hypothetical protein